MVTWPLSRLGYSNLVPRPNYMQVVGKLWKICCGIETRNVSGHIL